MHGAAAMLGLTTAADGAASMGPASAGAVGTTGVMPAAYASGAAGPSTAPAGASRLQKVVGADGRAVWIVKQ